MLAPDPHEILGCNTRAELAEVDRIFRARKRAELMDAGVTIYLPQSVVIDPDVKVGPDTIVEPGAQLLGTTRIGANSRIGAGSILTDSVLADGVTIEPHCVVTSSRIGPQAKVGPFARLRPGSDLRAHVHVGNFVETKNAVLGEWVKANHLSYLGDARVGAKSNIGAGTITCNYDGVQKHQTTIGKNVFIGSDTALVAPVRVGDGAYVAAGSTITENVPADALGIARGRQVNKPGWAAARRREMQKSPPRRVQRTQRKKSKRARPRKSNRRPTRRR